MVIERQVWEIPGSNIVLLGIGFTLEGLQSEYDGFVLRDLQLISMLLLVILLLILAYIFMSAFRPPCLMSTIAY